MTLEQRITDAVDRFRAVQGRGVRAVYISSAEYDVLEQELVAKRQYPPAGPHAVAMPPELKRDRVVHRNGFDIVRARNARPGWAILRPGRGATYHFPLQAV